MVAAEVEAVYEELLLRGRATVQWAKAPVAKSDELGSLSWTHIVQGKSQCLQIVL